MSFWNWIKSLFTRKTPVVQPLPKVNEPVKPVDNGPKPDSPAPKYWKPHKYHPIASVPAPYTHLHPYDFICEFALGQKEIPGSKDNGLLAHTHEHCKNLGSHSDTNDYHDEVPYCSSGLNWTADGCGCEKTDHALASSWDNYIGKKLKKGDKVSKGDIVRIKDSNHVTLANRDFTWTGSGYFEGTGFNQGNMVKVSIYPQSRIVTVHKWQPKPGTVLRPIQKQAVLGSTSVSESTR